MDVIQKVTDFIQKEISIGGFTASSVMVTLIIGIVLCFFGFKAAKILGVLMGFVFGVYVGFYLGNKFFSSYENVPMIAALAMGVVCAVLFFLVAQLGLFALVTCSAFVSLKYLFALLTPYVPEFTEKRCLLASIILALIFGGIAVAKTREIVILITGCSGAVFFAGGVMDLIHVPNPTAKAVVTLGIFAVMAELGLHYQFKNNPKGKK